MVQRNGLLWIGLVVLMLAAVCLVCVGAKENARAKAIGAMTAADVIERIKQNVTCQWSQQTVDTFKAGDPDVKVTAIAVSCFASLDVLKKAAASGCNLVITHEPTFYHHNEDTTRLEGDAVLAAKQKFIADNGLVVWRFHDHIHRNDPDGIVKGMIEKFGWDQYRQPGEQFCFKLPATTVGQFAGLLKSKLSNPVIRVVGDPDMKFTRFAFSPGAPGSTGQMNMLGRDDVEVLVGGETCEWETVEYTRDAISAGKKKAFIVLGHCNSEEAGMEYCASWLRTFVKEVPVEFIPAGDPFWSP